MRDEANVFVPEKLKCGGSCYVPCQWNILGKYLHPFLPLDVFLHTVSSALMGHVNAMQNNNVPLI
jgi:hypothetical protein